MRIEVNQDKPERHKDESKIVQTPTSESDTSSISESLPKTGVTVKFAAWPKDRTFQPRSFQQSKASLIAKFKTPLATALGGPKTIPITTSGSEVKRFGSIEHKDIGNRAFKKFCEEKLLSVSSSEDGAWIEAIKKLCEELKKADLFKSDELQFKIADDNFFLMPGDLVCLSGDFYGPHPIEKPICSGRDEEEKEERFKSAYEQLVKAKRVEVKALLKEIEDVDKEIHKRIREESVRPSIALLAKGMESDKKFAELTALSTHTILPFPFFHNRYLTLAQYNFDHFGEDARQAYRAGHRVACETAKQARYQRRLDLFVQAFAQELFACHYLTDLFSSGHMRTPRKELYNHVLAKGWTPGKLKIAGLLAKEMHDEDNQKGLLVASTKCPTPWKAFGDDCYFDPEDGDNREEVVKAVQAGLENVFSMYQGGELVLYSAEAYLPKPLEGTVQFNPLFKIIGGQVAVREDVNDTECSKYSTSWSPTLVLLKRKAHKATPDGKKETLSESEQEQLSKELEVLDQENIAVECKVM